jgi:hypothetical protein
LCMCKQVRMVLRCDVIVRVSDLAFPMRLRSGFVLVH